MQIRNVLVVDRLGRELASGIAEARPDLEVRRAELDAVRPEELSWADVYVGFRLPPGTSEATLASLAWVHSTGAGVDGFLDGRSWPAHVVLTRTTGGFGARIGEYCIAHALAHLQHVRAYRDAQRAGRWTVREARELAGTRALVVGTGSVGRGIARRFVAMGVTVIGVARRAEPAEPFENVIMRSALGEVLGKVDWIVLAVPLTPETRGWFGRDVLSLARGAYLINVARGAVAPEEELRVALDEGWLEGATLDVFEKEPLPSDSPLWKDERVAITPHVAARTLPEEALHSFLEALGSLERSQEPRLRADTQLGY